MHLNGAATGQNDQISCSQSNMKLSTNDTVNLTQDNAVQTGQAWQWILFQGASGMDVNGAAPTKGTGWTNLNPTTYASSVSWWGAVNF